MGSAPSPAVCGRWHRRTHDGWEATLQRKEPPRCHQLPPTRWPTASTTPRSRN